MKSANDETLAVMVSGMVTSFDSVRGYGFVAQGGGRELFAEWANAPSANPGILALGERVIFEVIQGPRGPHVGSVRRF